MGRNNTTFRAISFVTVVTLAAKSLGVVREILQANAFGTSPQFDLYSTAYNHTIYIFTTLAYALCVAAVPIITKKLAESREAAERVAGNLISVCLLISILAVSAGYMAISFLPIENGFGVAGERLAQLQTYLRICLVTLPIIVLIYLLVSVFQSMGYYSLQGSMSIPYNLALIVVLLSIPGTDRMLEYIIAVCFAWGLQLLWIVPCARRERFRLRLSLRFQDRDLRVFGKTALVTLFTSSIFLLCYLTDAKTVSSFGDGAVSGVYYADKLFTPIVTTVVYSISVVLFPKYNQEYCSADDQQYKSYVGTTLGNTLFVILPLSVLLGAFSLPIVRVLFERGSFDASSSAMTVDVFSMYALGMAGFCILDLMNKAYYTMRKTMEPLLINGLVFVLNLFLNRLLASQADPGSIALATSLSLSFGGILSMICFFRNSKGAFSVSRVGKELFCVAVVSVLAYFFASAFSGINLGKLMSVVLFSFLGVVCLGVYGLLCWLLQDRSVLQNLFHLFRKGRN